MKCQPIHRGDNMTSKVQHLHTPKQVAVLTLKTGLQSANKHWRRSSAVRFCHAYDVKLLHMCRATQCGLDSQTCCRQYECFFCSFKRKTKRLQFSICVLQVSKSREKVYKFQQKESYKSPEKSTSQRRCEMIGYLICIGNKKQVIIRYRYQLKKHLICVHTVGK